MHDQVSSSWINNISDYHLQFQEDDKNILPAHLRRLFNLFLGKENGEENFIATPLYRKQVSKQTFIRQMCLLSRNISSICLYDFFEIASSVRLCCNASHSCNSMVVAKKIMKIEEVL